ncbi:HNH endonuclease [Candidatus Saccharibacteria bacterium]|jgi:hypothetical protein|nr:HNH endonuclease [Candidatus Saccharibacteria bacterium]
MTEVLKPNYRVRRLVALLIIAIISLSGLVVNVQTQHQEPDRDTSQLQDDQTVSTGELAIDVIDKLDVKGRAPKTGYKRAQFGNGWLRGASGCDTRNVILKRDLKNTKVGGDCRVLSGLLHDPYTGKEIDFLRGPSTSDKVQIDHIVALSNAWQTGAQLLSLGRRIEFANDPLNLLAVDGRANQQKGDGDAATWLPPRKNYRCAYVARQIKIKYSYGLWLTPAEKTAMQRVLRQCPNQRLIEK